MPRTLGTTHTDTPTRFSLAVPKPLTVELNKKLLDEGYGQRERSRWICEAIETLIETPAYEELVAEDYIRRGHNTSMNVTLSNDTYRRLTQAVIYVEKNTGLSDVTTKLIRTAIMQRLLSPIKIPYEKTT